MLMELHTAQSQNIRKIKMNNKFAWYDDPVYIKMCKKAEEIQTIWDIDKAFGDFVFIYGDNNNETHICNGYKEWDDECKHKSDELTWLPRQDQLQKMFLKKDNSGYEIKSLKNYGCFVWLNKKCMESYERNLVRFIEPYPNGEKLWLVFVMEKKYNKIWSGEKWEEK